MQFFNPKLLIAFTLFAFFSSKVVAQSNTCSGATLITPDSVCKVGTSSFTGQTLTGATSDGFSIANSCGFNTATDVRDVWYKFVARTKTPLVSLTNLGAGWGNADKVYVQILSNVCGNAAVQFACGKGITNASSVTVTPTLATPLIVGNTYLIRIHNNTNTVAANSSFNICVTDFSKSSRMNEVFEPNVLSAPGVLQFPWEVAYSADTSIFVTESKGYKIYKINPNTAARTMVLDISQGSTFLPLAERAAFNCQFANGAGAQGGLAGMALHPNFLDGTANENNSVFVSYIYNSNGGTAPTGKFYTNKLVRFQYNKGSGLMGSPVAVCDTLTGSSDHNSQRMIIAPTTVGGTNFLFTVKSAI